MRHFAFGLALGTTFGWIGGSVLWVVQGHMPNGGTALSALLPITCWLIYGLLKAR